MNQAHVVTTAVLALDTSTPVLSVALGRDGSVDERSVQAGRHTGALVPKIVAEVLAAAQCTAGDLTVIGVGVGPGPYTSLRAGIMFAEAAAAALQIPVMGACSLDVIARQHASATELPTGGEALEGAPVPGAADEFVVATDARRRELYWARYDSQGRRLTGPRVDPRAELEARWAEQRLAVITSPPSAGVLARWVLEECRHHGGGLPPLAATPEQWAAPSQDAADLQIPQALLTPRPLYLRRPDAVEPTAAAKPTQGGPT